MTAPKKTNARFDTRLSQEQKELFEQAAQLGGYRNLTDFVLMTVQERAVEIVRESEQVLASRRDGELFFEAILNPAAPHANLRAAAKRYEDLTRP